MLIDKQIMEHYKNINTGDLCTVCRHTAFSGIYKNENEVRVVPLSPGDIIIITSVILDTEHYIKFGAMGKGCKGSIMLSKRATYGPFIEKIC